MNEFIEINVDETMFENLNKLLAIEDIFKLMNSWFLTFEVGQSIPQASLVKEKEKFQVLKLCLKSLRRDQNIKLFFKLEDPPTSKRAQIYLKKIIVNYNKLQAQNTDFEIVFKS